MNTKVSICGGELKNPITVASGTFGSGMEYEDVFYTHILKKMVIISPEHIDVYLNLLPFIWSYAISKVSNKGDKAKWSISDASVPISVSNPFNSSKGIAYRWDK